MHYYVGILENDTLIIHFTWRLATSLLNPMGRRVLINMVLDNHLKSSTTSWKL